MKVRLKANPNAPNWFSSGRSVSTAFLCLDDIDIPAIFLRDCKSEARDEEVNDRLAMQSWMVTDLRWKNVTEKQVTDKEAAGGAWGLPLTKEAVADRSATVINLPKRRTKHEFA